MRNIILQSVVLALCSAPCLCYEWNCTFNAGKLAKLHSETSKLASSRAVSDATLYDMVNMQICQVYEGLYRTKPRTSTGSTLKNRLLSLLSRVGDLCTNISCLSGTFRLDGIFYLPYINHANIIIPYAKLNRNKLDRALTAFVKLLPWCLGADPQMNNCNIDDQAWLERKIYIMCQVARGTFPPCREY